MVAAARSPLAGAAKHVDLRDRVKAPWATTAMEPHSSADRVETVVPLAATNHATHAPHALKDASSVPTTARMGATRVAVKASQDPTRSATPAFAATGQHSAMNPVALRVRHASRTRCARASTPSLIAAGTGATATAMAAVGVAPVVLQVAAGAALQTRCAPVSVASNKDGSPA